MCLGVWLCTCYPFRSAHSQNAHGARTWAQFYSNLHPDAQFLRSKTHIRSTRGQDLLSVSHYKKRTTMTHRYWLIQQFWGRVGGFVFILVRYKLTQTRRQTLRHSGAHLRNCASWVSTHIDTFRYIWFVRLLITICCCIFFSHIFPRTQTHRTD